MNALIEAPSTSAIQGAAIEGTPPRPVEGSSVGESGHSPAPWSLDWQPVPGHGVHENFPDLHYVGIQSANYYDVAPYGLSIAGYMRKEDAYLIAAAPDLLKALKEVLASQTALMPPFEAGKEAQDEWINRREKARNDAVAAIAKAQGRS